jgi:hypothetical protein
VNEVFKMKKQITGRYLWIISISMVVFFSVIGIGYAYWGTAINVCSFISTGSMDVVFDSCTYEDEEDIATVSDIEISEDQKNIKIDIENAYSGYSVAIKYRILNNGDIPVYCKVTSNEESFADIEFEDPERVIDPNGEAEEGTVTITITDQVTGNTAYQLNLYLDYVQYNEEPEESL